MVGKHAHIENRVFMVIRAKKSMIHLSEKLRIAAHLKPWVHTGDRVIIWRAAADAGLTWISTAIDDFWAWHNIHWLAKFQHMLL